MDALPISDALLPATLAVAVVVTLPVATARFLEWVYLTDLPAALTAKGEERGRALAPFRRAALIVGLAQTALAFMLGATRLGPSLVEAPGGPMSLLFGALLAALSVVVTRTATRASRSEPQPTPQAVLGAQGAFLGATIAVSVLAVPVALHLLTDVPPTAIMTMTPAEAQARFVIDPWDGEPMVALAWRAREAGDLPVAEARAEAAERMGADPQSVHLIWAELHAAAGDCAAAQASFEASLAAQAAAIFDGDPFRPLDLGSYSLPPTFVTDCEMTVGEVFGEGAVDEDGNMTFSGSPPR